MTDLTEKNLENVLLNLTKTGKPITVKPTTWFGNPAKTAQWYTCPNCSKQSPLTLEWVGLTRDEQSFVYSNLHNATSREDSFWVDFANAIEAKLREVNNG
jgi:hypothetical protein